MVYGVLMILIVYFLPQGIVPASSAGPRIGDGPARRVTPWSRPAGKCAKSDGAGRHRSLVEHVAVRFGGLMAVVDLFRGARGRDPLSHRSERRRQDHGLQRHHRLPEADGGNVRYRRRRWWA